MDIEELLQTIKQLELQKYQLQQTVQQIEGKLQQERCLWNQQHCKLTKQIQNLRDEVVKLQEFVEQLYSRNQQLVRTNQETCQQLQQMTFLLGKRTRKIDGSDYYSREDERVSFKKIASFNESFQEKREQDHLVEQFSNIVKNAEAESEYKSKRMDNQLSEINQIVVPQAHNLEDQLKDITSFNEPTNPSYYQRQDRQSSFTAQYFKYNTDSHLHSDLIDHHLSNLYEDYVQDDFGDDEEYDFVENLENWAERLSYFIGGSCMGAYFLWRFKK